MMRLLLVLLPLLSTWSQAETPDVVTDGNEVPVLDMVLVTGEQPGPGLWRVSRNEHVMWVLGTVSPLPKRMEWVSDEVTARIAESGALLYPPSVKFDAGVGRVRGLFLLPSLLRARNNPDGQRLRDILPADLHQRWSVLKARYIGSNRSVERRRPIFAAQQLYNDMLKRLGLDTTDVVRPVLGRAAEAAGIGAVRPTIDVQITDARQTLKAFNRSSLDDLDCFRISLEFLESDPRDLIVRANAWAQGDLATLREIPLADPIPTCIDALLDSAILADQGFANLPRLAHDAWITEAERLLAEHRTTFAVLNLRQVLDTDSYLQTLAARGYRIESPEELEALDFTDDEAEITPEPADEVLDELLTE